MSVKEDGELFATEVVCDVAEGEQRRRLNILEALGIINSRTTYTHNYQDTGH